MICIEAIAKFNAIFLSYKINVKGTIGRLNKRH